MEKYQQELFNKLVAYNRADTEFTIWSASIGGGKSRYQELMAQPFFEVLDDHSDYPNHKRVDVNRVVSWWVEEQDISQWKFDVNVVDPYSRYIITPELLTLIALKFSR